MKKWGRPIKVATVCHRHLAAQAFPYWNPYNPDGSAATNANGGWTGTTVNPIEWMDNNPVTNKEV